MKTDFKSLNKIWFNLLEYLPGKYGLTTTRFFTKRSKALKNTGEYKGQILCFKNADGVIHRFYQWDGFKWVNATRKEISFPTKRFQRTR